VSLRNTLDYHIENSLNDRYRKIESYKNSPILRNPEKIIENCELYLDILNSRINESYKDMLASYTSSFFSLYSKLDSLSPLKVLSRGYSIVKKEDSIINNSKSLSIDDVVSIRLADCEVKAKIIEVQLWKLHMNKLKNVLKRLLLS
jgi:exodeoxyribonuclease VII large subunit